MLTCWYWLRLWLKMERDDPIVSLTRELGRFEIHSPSRFSESVHGEESFPLKLLKRSRVESERGTNKDPVLQFVQLDFPSLEDFVDFFFLLLIRSFPSKRDFDPLKRVIVSVSQTILFCLHIWLHRVLHDLDHLEVHVAGEVDHVELVPDVLVLLPLAEQEVDCLC